jgi:aminoglycoside-2''-adenylyltransferase
MLAEATLENVAGIFDLLPVTWGFCGGWAIDLYLDRKTRPHKDVDVAIWRDEQTLVFDALRRRGWSLNLAVDGKLTPLQAGVSVEEPYHTIWCRHPRFQPAFVEVLLNERIGDRFLFRRNHAFWLPLDSAFLTAPCGLPILAPEIALLYKSNDLTTETNGADFAAALPHLGATQRQWLFAALATQTPAHPWLATLAEGA